MIQTSKRQSSFFNRIRAGAILHNLAKITRFVYISAVYNENTIAAHFRNQGAQVGQGCRFYTRILGDEPYLVRIGDHVTVAAGVTFVTHDGAAWSGRQEIPDLQVFGPIIIGNNCVIGQNAILFPNIRIGDNCIIGAGSVVISDIPSNTMVMGVPARQFGSIEVYKNKCIERWNVQKPPDIVLEPGEDWWNSKHYNTNRQKLKDHLTKLFWDNYPNDNTQNDPTRK